MVMEVSARTWLAEARRQWQRQRAELVADGLVGQGEAAATGELDHGGQHPADLASELLEREIDLGLIDEAEDILAEIDAAEARLEAGTYGRCETCDAAIAYERLRAVPWARRCVAHQVPIERYEAI
jgi:RNA polymerase-binding transcription factor DksA